MSEIEKLSILDENEVLSNGAVSYYTIYFATDETLTLEQIITKQGTSKD